MRPVPEPDNVQVKPPLTIHARLARGDRDFFSTAGEMRSAYALEKIPLSPLSPLLALPSGYEIVVHDSHLVDEDDPWFHWSKPAWTMPSA